MEDNTKAAAATPASMLEEQIMNVSVPKSEREWWAHREITRLRERLSKFEVQYWIDLNNSDETYKSIDAMMDEAPHDAETEVEGYGVIASGKVFIRNGRTQFVPDEV